MGLVVRLATMNHDHDCLRHVGTSAIPPPDDFSRILARCERLSITLSVVLLFPIAPSVWISPLGDRFFSRWEFAKLML